jgi:Xaa-Pro aminopeptidase
VSASSDKSTTAERVSALRQALAQNGFDGFVVPRSDSFLGEYVPPSDERLAWLTGFTGSAGSAVVLAEQAALFVDGRYTLQAANEVDPSVIEVVAIAETTPEQWITNTLGQGKRLGYDPRLHSHAGVERLARAAEAAGGALLPVVPNPIDSLWRDRPAPPLGALVPHDMAYAGREARDKRAEIAADLAAAGQDAAIITAPDSVAWLLNVRGSDLEFSPVALACALLRSDGQATLFIDPRKVDDRARAHLGNEVATAPLDSFGEALAQLGAEGARVRVDAAGSSDWVYERLAKAGAAVVEGPDPCVARKAIKNPVELHGMRHAHARDGVALSRFLHWLAVDGAGATEIDAADRLEALRRENEHITGLSFPTISGAGANGAIVHYRVSEASNRPLEPGSLYLVDSGAQYLDGTTDVTRTVAVGAPSAEMRDRFTRVLKGHIAIATARFPKGTSGSQIDALARLALWQAGLDYDHGTGHGVGSYLNVHEGPHRISKRGGDVALEPGMIVSNEPGYYKTGAYGIRIENLVAVSALGVPEGGERETLGFETLTRAPIDRALIEPALLTDAECAWLDSYHESVFSTVAPKLDADDAAWLRAATRPIREAGA